MSQNTQGAFTAFLIDPNTRTIEPVAMPGGAGQLATIYNLLGCTLITAAGLTEHDSIYCDDEGLLKGPVYQFFGVRGHPEPLAGRGLVVGIDAEGRDVAPVLSLEELRRRTFFIEHLMRSTWGVTPATALDACEVMPSARMTAMLAGEACHG